MTDPAEIAQQIQSDMEKFVFDPLRFCQYAYPWGEGELEAAALRKWQIVVLQHLGAHLKNPKTRHTPCRLAICSGNGIGKSGLISMIINWGMSTCTDCRILATAVTRSQLRAKLVPEVSLWFRRAINAAWWRVESESIRIRLKKHEKTWRTDFVAWEETNPEAFQGLHNKNKRIIVIFDEASGIPAPIWKAAEKSLTDEDTELIFIACFNPTKNTGPSAECFGVDKGRWKGWQIDSRTVEGTNKQELNEIVAHYGEDSDHVRIMVKGEFPRANFNQLISLESVARCRRFLAEGYGSLPKILSIDVARFGDDQSAIGMRQGRKLKLFETMRGKDTVQVAEHAIEWIKKEKPDAIVVDGDGLGAGVVDHLRLRNYNVFEFHGGAEARNAKKYFNRRAECWGLLGEALAAGCEIPDSAELERDLTGPMYGYNASQQIQLERKEDMKKRGLASPDLGDCFAMTYGVDISPTEKHSVEQGYNWSHGFPVTSPGGWMALIFL